MDHPVDPADHPSTRGSKRRLRAVLGLLAVVGGCAATLAVPAATALAATTSLSAPTSLTGSQTLSSTGITASGLGVTATFDLNTTLNWTQAASIGTSFDTNLVRQGRSLVLSDSYTRTSPGSMSMTWTLHNLAVSWDGIGPLSLGSPGFSATGSCDLKADGSTYDCTLSSGSQVALLDPFPLPGPYVKLGLGADVSVTSQGLATMRQATFGGNPDGSAGLTLGETPITDTLQVPCTVGAGDELDYSLGSLSTTPGVNVTTSLVFNVGLESPTPITVVPEIDASFASPTIPLSSAASTIAMSGVGATFDLGAVQANNIPPTADPGSGGAYSGNEGAAIAFDGTGSSSICGFPTLVWNFSDGGVAYGPSPTHTFPGSGTYTGLLTATDVTGLTATATFTVTLANLPPVVDAGPDTTSAWGIPVSFNGSATDPGTADQSTLTYSWDFGDGSPSASGGASTTHTYLAPGDYTATLTSCDQYGACASASRTVQVVKRNTTTSYLGASSGTYDTAGPLSASVVDQFGQPVAGASVSFQVGSDGPFTASTDPSGTAQATYSPTLAAGSYTATASYAGDSLYNPSTSSAVFSVAKEVTVVAYTGATSARPNKTVALSAVLNDADGRPLAGRVVTFNLGTQTASATTDANGVAATTLKLAQHVGTYTVSATYTPTGGDASHYLGSSQGTVFTI